MSDELKSQIKQAIVRSLKLPIDPNGDRQRRAPVRRRPRPRFHRRAGAGARAGTIVRRRRRRRADGRPGAALGRRHRRVRHRAAGQRRLLIRIGRVINAFTIDVEEWFHVCGVPAVAGPSAWDGLESRVVDDTQRTLDLLDRCGVRATCFVVGWVAERHPRIVARIRDAGPRDRQPRPMAPPRLRARCPTSSRAICDSPAPR